MIAFSAIHAEDAFINPQETLSLRSLMLQMRSQKAWIVFDYLPDYATDEYQKASMSILQQAISRSTNDVLIGLEGVPKKLSGAQLNQFCDEKDKASEAFERQLTRSVQFKHHVVAGPDKMDGMIAHLLRHPRPGQGREMKQVPQSELLLYMELAKEFNSGYRQLFWVLHDAENDPYLSSPGVGSWKLITHNMASHRIQFFGLEGDHYKTNFEHVCKNSGPSLMTCHVNPCNPPSMI